MIAYLLIGTVSVFGNFLVLVVIRKCKELRHSQYIYKASIAVSDIFWGSIVSFQSIHDCVRLFSEDYYALYERNYRNVSTAEVNNVTVTNFNVDVLTIVPRSKTEYKVGARFMFNFVLSATFLVSLVTLNFAAFDRFIALAYPFKYKRRNTLKYAKVVSVVVWVACLALFGASFKESSLDSFETTNYFLQPVLRNEGEGVFVKIFSILLFVIFLSLWLLTILTIKSLYNHLKVSKNLNKSNADNLAKEKQMSVILLVMVVVFTVCLSLTLFSHVCNYVCEESYYHLTQFKILYPSMSLLATNSIWNFVIYNVMNKNFRTALMSLFRKK